MTVYIDWICDRCKHQFDELIDGWDVGCDAFPGGIDIEFWKNRPRTDNEVLEYFSNCNNGIGYEPKEQAV